MKVPSEQKAIQGIAARLAGLVGVDQSEIRVETGSTAPDGIIFAGPFTFVIEWNGEAAPRWIRAGR
jgi:hypothetical protein